jgi:type I restriction enzyme S subunit
VNSSPTQKLGELVEVRHGYAFKSENFVDEGPFVLVTPGNFEDHGGFKFRDKQKFYDGPVPNEFVLNPGDLLVAMTEQGEGLLGSAAFVPGGKPCLHNQRLGRVLPRDSARVDLRFVYYLFNSRPVRAQIRGAASGAKIRHTAPGRIYAVDVPRFPIAEQRRIASILGAYDDLIEVNRRRIAVLEAMARDLFAEWFVRFRFPGHEGVEIVETTRGAIPRDWRCVAFSDLAQFINGFAFKPSDFEPYGLPVVKIPELKGGVSHKTPRNSGDRVPDKLHLENGDLIFSWSGTLAVSEWTCGPALLNQHLFLVVPEGLVGRGFLKAAIEQAMPRFLSQGVGATMQHIRRAALDTTYVALPVATPLLATADSALTSFYDQVVCLRRASHSLTAARNLLLPRLISGELSVAAAERQLDDAA